MVDVAEWFIWPKGTKYPGKKIHQTPDSYLRWASENWSNDDVANACYEELKWRDKYNEHIEDD